MKKVIMAVMAIFAYALIADSAIAATTTGTLDVTASVAASCTVISAANVPFGAYDPTAPYGGVGLVAGPFAFTFRCVKSTNYKLHIARNNSMTSGADTLAYNLYTDAGTSSPWASTAPVGWDVASPALNNGVISKDIYGKILPYENAAVAALYSETVTVTVTY